MKQLKLSISIALIFASSAALGAPFVVSDLLTSGVSQCGILLDTGAKFSIPVTAVITPVPGNICKFDLIGTGPGSHSIRMTAIISDPVFGVKESLPSLPLAFTVPSAPAQPAGLLLVP